MSMRDKTDQIKLIEKNSHDWLYHNQSVDFLLSVQVLGRADSHRLFRRLDEMLKLDMHSLVLALQKPSEALRLRQKHFPQFAHSASAL